MNKSSLTLMFLLLGMIYFSTSAYAYIGPGLGLGGLGVVLGLILSVLLAIVGIIWYPFKRLLRKEKEEER